MKPKFFFNYRVFIWTLILLAFILAVGMLTVAYTFNLQKKIEKKFELTQKSISNAKELEVELFNLRNFTFIYIDDKSKEWIDSISVRKKNLIIFLERARKDVNSTEEANLINQISGLLSNYELNLNSAKLLANQNNLSQANALLTHSAKDLLGTIHEKIRLYINLNQESNLKNQTEIARSTKIIFNVMLALGIGGVIVGIFLGWVISKILFIPFKQLMVTIRDASSEAVIESMNISEGDELEELSKRIKELIEKINTTQEDLKKNKQLLQYSNKHSVLGKVAPTIAHEIRNPLTAIKMLIYSMKKEEQDQQILEKDINIILSEIDRVEDFIKNFLKFAKPTDPDFIKSNPALIISEVIILLKSRFKEKKISVEFVDENSNYEVMADSGQLKQLFMNLLINALEAIPHEGNITIYSKVETQSEKQYLKISVEDTGPGIPENIIKSLFEPFVKGNEQGVGLGLSISQNIATMHHGWIQAENKPNKAGAIFNVFLPIVF